MEREWTKDEIETATDMLIDRLDADPANKEWSRWTVDAGEIKKLGCEFNDLRLRAASSPEAAGRGDGLRNQVERPEWEIAKEHVQDVWPNAELITGVSGGRKIYYGVFVAGEGWKSANCPNVESAWTLARLEAPNPTRPAPPSGEQSQPCEYCDNGRCTVNDGGELVAGSDCLKRAAAVDEGDKNDASLEDDWDELVGLADLEECVHKSEVAPGPQEGHSITEREQRNGFTYIHCSCGVEIGPFHIPDYAEDAFDQHAGPQEGRDG